MSLTLVACLLYLLLSSRYASNFVKSYLSLTDDMSTIGRTVLFGLLLTLAMQML
jgi:hypothetical protein